MEAALTRALPVEAEFVRGDGGVFDVVADGRSVFPKHAEGRFPAEDGVIETIRALGKARATDPTPRVEANSPSCRQSAAARAGFA